MSSMNKYCPNGHMYDSSLPSCPYCLPGQQGSLGPTQPVNQPQGGYIPPTQPANQPVGPTQPANRSAQMQTPTEFVGGLATQPGSTLSKTSKERVQPVVGWLVCVKGPDIGKDFRLHANYNYIGRNQNQDVCLNDPKVSGEHLELSYDLRSGKYFLTRPGRSTNMAYINGIPLNGSPMLQRGDQIEVGDTMLVFIPLEPSDVKWNWKI